VVSEMAKINSVYRSSLVRLKKNSNYKGTYKKAVKEPSEISPVTEANASSDREIDNHSLSMRLYYESVKEQREEYKHFYRDEQELEHDLKNIAFNDKHFLEKVRQLIHTYNHTILSLTKFDKSFNTQFTEEVIHLLQRHDKPLLNIGVKILVDGELYIYNTTFEETYKKDPNAFRFLIGHDRSLFFKLYQLLQTVKIPQVEQEAIETQGYVGTIIDAKG
jgi:hypothetical protein